MHEQPNIPAYLTAASAVRAALHETMQQAIADLPASIRAQHWMASKHSPAAWRSVEHWYISQTPRDQRILDTLTNLALLSDALACLQSVTLTQATTSEQPLDLTLKKQRRVTL